MNDSARVRNIEVLAELRAALVRFAHEAGLALDSADGEVRKTQQWLEDQARHWQSETRRREEDVFVARQELARKRMRKVGDQSVDCWEEEQKLRRAQARLEHASEKLDRVRYWMVHWSNETIEYEGPSRQLRSFIEGDLSRATALLERKADSLDAYLSVPSPEIQYPSGIGSHGKTAMSRQANESSDRKKTDQREDGN